MSDCGLYRYSLRRSWWDDSEFALSTPKAACFVMLNPSTADHEQDDPTIRRVMGFARRWGFGEVTVVNLFAYRATVPKVLWESRRSGIDIIGPRTDENIKIAARASERVICAWGAAPEAKDRARGVMELLRKFDPVCLGVTKSGDPKHPLYLRNDVLCSPYEPGTVATFGQSH